MPCAPFSREQIKGILRSFTLPESVHPSCSRDPMKGLTNREQAASLKHDGDSDRDIKKINGSLQSLRTSGWFYEGINRHDAKLLLKGYSEGAFIMRNSVDPRYLFALSVQTRRGITSIRILYNGGKFHLDCEDVLVGQMPMFDNVVDLVHHYMRLSKAEGKHKCVWLDRGGRRDLPVKLVNPVLKQVSSLQHLCRTTINSVLPQENIGCVQLPKLLKRYLQEYPHHI